MTLIEFENTRAYQSVFDYLTDALALGGEWCNNLVLKWLRDHLLTTT